MEKKLKKERLFYLDLIRAIAAIMIVTYHFAVHFTSDLVPMPLLYSRTMGLNCSYFVFFNFWNFINV